MAFYEAPALVPWPCLLAFMADMQHSPHALTSQLGDESPCLIMGSLVQDSCTDAQYEICLAEQVCAYT